MTSLLLYAHQRRICGQWKRFDDEPNYDTAAAADLLFEGEGLRTANYNMAVAGDRLFEPLIRRVTAGIWRGQKGPPR
jgi:hypothetical protein